MKSVYLIISSVLILSACDSGMSQWKVENHGVLREIMREQKIGANADLQDYSDLSNLYAMGALEGLGGEILVLNSEPLNSMAKNGALVFDKSFDQKATLLVYSQVKDWERISIKATISNMEELQALIAKEAAAYGLNTSEAFPFMLKGDFQSIAWHVINAKEAEEQSHEAYKKAGLKGEDGFESAQILGFYSERHEGVFTHHGSYLHMHFINSDQTIMGHVDGLVNEGELELWLPKMKAS